MRIWPSWIWFERRVLGTSVVLLPAHLIREEGIRKIAKFPPPKKIIILQKVSDPGWNGPDMDPTPGKKTGSPLESNPLENPGRSMVLILDGICYPCMKENRSFRRKNIRFMTALDLIKCLKQQNCFLRAHLFLSYHLI